MTAKQISISTSRSHWRAGVYFEKGKPKIVNEGDFTDEQLEQLDDDPELLVAELEGFAEGSDQALSRPVDEEGVRATIQTAILNSLNPKKDFTQAGKPRVDALEKALGWKASSDEISVAMDAMSEEQKAQLENLLKD